MAAAPGPGQDGSVSAPALSAMPSGITAGTTLSYTRSYSDYSPADSWALKVYIAGVSIAPVITGTVSGSTWNVTLAASETAKLKPGRYQWQERVSKGSEEYVAAQGVLVISANIATATAGSMQTHAERMLAAIESVLEGRIPADVDSYQIAGRSLTRIPVPELRTLRAQYAAEVSAQRAPGKFGRTVFGQFTAD